jgi:hypothetical protein
MEPRNWKVITNTSLTTLERMLRAMVISPRYSLYYGAQSSDV